MRAVEINHSLKIIFKEVSKVFGRTDSSVRIAVTHRETDTLTSQKSGESKPFKCCRMQFFHKKRHIALKLSITSGFNIESLHRRQMEKGGVGGRRRRTDIHPVCIYIIRLRLLLFLLQASLLLASESVFCLQRFSGHTRPDLVGTQGSIKPPFNSLVIFRQYWNIPKWTLQGDIFIRCLPPHAY